MHAQPELVQLAAQQPAQPVAVIVQKVGNDSSPEQMAVRLGGEVTGTLQIINAFVAKLPAAAALELARQPEVRWVSLDSPVKQADATDTTVTTVTWATNVGSLVPNGFTNPMNMVDSELGPDSTYGYGSNVKGSFTSFDPEITPGYAITKVEIALQVYTSAQLTTGDNPQVMIYVGGQQIMSLSINNTLFAPFAGAANAGTLYVDLTQGHTWTWADFNNGIEVVIDQTMFTSGNVIDYDAVGVRVTSAPGTDTSTTATQAASSSSNLLGANSLTSSITAGVTSPSSSASSSAVIDTSQLANVFNQVIGSSKLWNMAARLRGKNITEAVVDSGFYSTSDLKGRILTNVNFNRSYHSAADLYGHGTFVAGIIAGNGAASKGKYIGVAPQLNLVNVRVSDDQGMTLESDVINGLQWVLNNKAQYNIRVVNLSLNSSVAEFYNTSPMDAAAEILWFNGIVIVVSAGNNGTATLYPPANDPFVITVGATNDEGTLSLSDDVIAPFSAYGVTESGFTKPDLVAPGTNIIGLLPDNAGLTIAKQHPQNQVDSTYFRMSGTSVSAPMVSGAVALLLQSNPYLTPDQVKYRLIATANKNWPGYNPATAGAGYLDVYAAVKGTTTQSANTGLAASGLLTTGSTPVNSSVSWNSVSWNSVSWNSVSWNSVSWNSVSWNSVSWNSDYWGN